MSIVQSVMIKNKEYDGVRLTIVGSQSGQTYYHYSEAVGVRSFVNEIGNPTSSMDSVSFNAYLSFTSSGTQSWDFNLVPMEYGSTSIIETKILGMKSDGTKGFLMNSFGGYRHSGSALTKIGGSFTYDYKSDFTGATAYFTASATASISLIIGGSSGDIIDWDVHIKYTKGYHTLTVSGGGGAAERPWYPPVPPQD